MARTTQDEPTNNVATTGVQSDGRCKASSQKTEEVGVTNAHAVRDDYVAPPRQENVVRASADNTADLIENVNAPEAVLGAETNMESEWNAEAVAAATRGAEEMSDIAQPDQLVGLTPEERDMLCDLPVGIITKTEWEEFTFRCGVIPNHRPILTQLLTACHELVDLYNHVTGPRSVQAVISMHQLINRRQDVGLPSMTNITQLTSLLNQFLLEYPEYLEDEASPCGELSTIYNQARNSFERELNAIVEAADDVLSVKVGAPQEAGTVAGYSHTNRVLRCVDELTQEMLMHREAGENLWRENEELRKHKEDSAKERESLMHKMCSLRENQRGLIEQIEVLKRRCDEADMRAISAEATKDQLASAHAQVLHEHSAAYARALEEQRMSYMQALDKECEALKKTIRDKEYVINYQKDMLKKKERERKFAQQAYISEHRKLQLCRRATPASEETRQQLVEAEVQCAKHKHENGPVGFRAPLATPLRLRKQNSGVPAAK